MQCLDRRRPVLCSISTTWTVAEPYLTPRRTRGWTGGRHPSTLRRPQQLQMAATVAQQRLLRRGTTTRFCRQRRQSPDANDDKVLSTTTTVSGRELDSTANRRYSSNGLNTDARRQTCAACGGDIVDRFLLHAVDRYWHIHCLRCSACQAVLADLGSTCFTRAGMTLCRNDYIR